MSMYFEILNKGTFECQYVKKCELRKKGSWKCENKDHHPLNEQYGFVLRNGDHAFDWLYEEVPNIPHRYISEFFHNDCDQFEPYLDLISPFVGENAQKDFKELKKMAQENLDFLDEHKIELKDSSGKEVLENILKIPVEEVYFLDAG